jgi:hypothetical protein
MTGPATAYPQKHGHSAFGWGERSSIYSSRLLALTPILLQAVESAQVGLLRGSTLLGAASADPFSSLVAFSQVNM